MELTKEQLSSVENYLLKKEVHFLDIKIEIFDHIASEIEFLIEEKGYKFEQAFHITTMKWNKYFVQKSSIYLGSTYYAPKIVIQKAKRSFKTHYLISITSYFILLIIFQNIEVQFSEKNITSLSFIFRGVAIVSGLFFLFTYYKKFKSKVKTTYSFILKTQTLNLLLFIIPISNVSYFLENGKINGIMIGLLGVLICTTITTNYFYKKHLEIASKFEKL